MLVPPSGVDIWRVGLPLPVDLVVKYFDMQIIAILTWGFFPIRPVEGEILLTPPTDFGRMAG